MAKGAKVALGGRRQARLDALVASSVDNAVGVAMDVRSPEDNARLVAAAVDRWGRLDSVVPNAGVGMYGGILDQSDEDLAFMMDTNYAGTVWSVRAALPAILATGDGGDVVIVSSVAGVAVARTRRCTPGRSMRRSGSPDRSTASCASRACGSR